MKPLYIALVATASLLLSACGGSSSGDGDGDGASGGNTTVIPTSAMNDKIEGTWHGVCAVGQVGAYDQIRITFSGSTFDSFAASYDDDACQTESFVWYKLSGDYTGGEDITSDTGLASNTINLHATSKNGVAADETYYGILSLESASTLYRSGNDVLIEADRSTALDFDSPMTKQ